MAQKVQYTLVDDLDGSSAEETVRFALDGASYEIDLSKGNAKKFRDSLAVYTGAARRASGRPARGRGRVARSTRAAGGSATAEIRAWAKAKGLKVNERGRIAADIVAKYEAAH